MTHNLNPIPPNPNSNTQLTLLYTALHFSTLPDENNVWAVGGSGIIFESNDGTHTLEHPPLFHKHTPSNTHPYSPNSHPHSKHTPFRSKHTPSNAPSHISSTTPSQNRKTTTTTTTTTTTPPTPPPPPPPPQQQPPPQQPHQQPLQAEPISNSWMTQKTFLEISTVLNSSAATQASFSAPMVCCFVTMPRHNDE